MMAISTKAVRGFLMIGLAVGVAAGSLGCPEKGSMEKAGEAVEGAGEAVEEAVDDAGREIEDATD